MNIELIPQALLVDNDVLNFNKYVISITKSLTTETMKYFPKLRTPFKREMIGKRMAKLRRDMFDWYEGERH